MHAQQLVCPLVCACSCAAPPLCRAVYAATKLYLDSLSRSLDAEARAFGVRVQNQWPMYVATRMPGIK